MDPDPGSKKSWEIHIKNRPKLQEYNFFLKKSLFLIQMNIVCLLSSKITKNHTFEYYIFDEKKYIYIF